MRIECVWLVGVDLETKMGGGQVMREVDATGHLTRFLLWRPALWYFLTPHFMKFVLFFETFIRIICELDCCTMKLVLDTQ